MSDWTGCGFQPPTMSGFQDFLQNIAGISPTYLPLSPVPSVVQFAYNLACQTVNKALCQSGVYTPAFYNLATSIVIHLAQDTGGYNYFSSLRSQLGIGKGFSAGVVTSTSDNGTSVTLSNPAWANGLTVANLQQLQDPFGQMYLSLAGDYGTVWTVV